MEDTTPGQVVQETKAMLGDMGFAAEALQNSLAVECLYLLSQSLGVGLLSAVAVIISAGVNSLFLKLSKLGLKLRLKFFLTISGSFLNSKKACGSNLGSNNLKQTSSQEQCPNVKHTTNMK